MTTHNVRPVPLPELDSVEWFDIEVTADLERGKEWTRNEVTGMLETWRQIDTACGKLGTPHKLGYRPDLPLRSTEASVAAWAHKLEQAYRRRVAELAPVAAAPVAAAPVAAAPAFGADHSELRKGKPHARSYRADLPLDGFTDAQLVRPTKDDKAAWLARPLVYVRPRPVAPEQFAEAAD